MTTRLCFPSARAGDEWLLTNGLGGFASGCASAIPARRYHHWLIAATSPPVGRVAVWHSCAEWLAISGAGKDGSPLRFALSSYSFPGGVTSPDGVSRLVSFERDITCQRAVWTYTIAELNLTISRELMLYRGVNAASVRYTVDGDVPNHTYFECRPFASMRDFHDLSSGASWQLQASQESSVRLIGASSGSLGVPALFTLRDCPGRFVAEVQTWRNFHYEYDRERGQSHTEDVASPGVFVMPVRSRSVCEVMCAAGNDDASSILKAADEVPRERTRLNLITTKTREMLRDTARETDVPLLVSASDQFIARRRTLRAPTRDESAAPSLTSIIAGYPWFGDWGRDTAISLPGLLLVTQRFDEARETLRAFAGMRRRGLIPNCFDNGSGSPEYNTVDASLWFVHACCAYLRASGDRATFIKDMSPACREVIDAYTQGTDHGIKVDPEDGLVAAGDESTQLTWMDAKRDGVVFTPRYGKAVEVNALWYSMLLLYADAVEPDAPRTSRELRQQASRAMDSFAAKFWNERAGCLFDVLVPTRIDQRTQWLADPSIRPNQVFALSLPGCPLPRDRQVQALAAIRKSLLTPMGLRTLAQGDSRYAPRYEGALFERDRAYHNGTVWPWLIGPFVRAVLNVEGDVPAARACIEPLLEALTSPDGAASHGPIAQLTEIYDAEAPRRPDGCLAQAWSIAQLLESLHAIASLRGGVR